MTSSDFELPNWLQELEAVLFAEFEPVISELKLRFPDWRYGATAHRWGQATGAKGYSICLSCTFPSDGYVPWDHISLVLSLFHVDTQPEMDADVCWGNPGESREFDSVHPIEATWVENRVPFNTSNQAALLETLPRLFTSLRSAIERGSPVCDD